jgi:hypothetical protein
MHTEGNFTDDPFGSGCAIDFRVGSRFKCNAACRDATVAWTREIRGGWKAPFFADHTPLGGFQNALMTEILPLVIGNPGKSVGFIFHQTGAFATIRPC